MNREVCLGPSGRLSVVSQPCTSGMTGASSGAQTHTSAPSGALAPTEGNKAVVISASSGSTLVEVLEKVYEEQRGEIVTPDLMITTPLMVLKEMASDFGVGVEVKTFEIHVPQRLPGPDSVIQRVTIKIGLVEGDGESPRYRLSLQLAAADMLEKLKGMGQEVKVYGMLPGSRLNPWVYKDLRMLAEIEGLASMPTFERVNPVDDKLFAWKCCIGQAETLGSSDSIFLAKRLAAKAMYEQLTGESYPKDRIATGMGCIQKEQFLEMGIVPVVTAKLGPIRSAMSTPAGSGMETPSRSSIVVEEEIFEDDYAEEEDDVTVAQHQLGTIRI